MSAIFLKNPVCQSHPRFCGALGKNTLTKFFLTCLLFIVDVGPFLNVDKILFYYYLHLFWWGGKKSKIFLLHWDYSVNCFRNELRYLTCSFSLFFTIGIYDFFPTARAAFIGRDAITHPKVADLKRSINFEVWRVQPLINKLSHWPQVGSIRNSFCLGATLTQSWGMPFFISPRVIGFKNSLFPGSW